MIFKDKNSKYPIRGCPDNVPGVFYHTSPKGFVNRIAFSEYIKENRAHYRSVGGRIKRKIFLNNASGHDSTEELTASLQALNVSLEYFPENATDLIQPVDSFIISKIKQHWTARRNAEKCSS